MPGLESFAKIPVYKFVRCTTGQAALVNVGKDYRLVSTGSASESSKAKMKDTAEKLAVLGLNYLLITN